MPNERLPTDRTAIIFDSEMQFVVSLLVVCSREPRITSWVTTFEWFFAFMSPLMTPEVIAPSERFATHVTDIPRRDTDLTTSDSGRLSGCSSFRSKLEGEERGVGGGSSGIFGFK